MNQAFAMDGGSKTAYHCLVLVLSLFLFFVEKVLFHWTDVLSDIAFAHQLLRVGPDDIQEDWKRYWFSNETTTPWRNEAATVLNLFGQAMVVPILMSLMSFFPYLYKKEATIGMKCFELFLVLFQFYPQYTAMKLMYQVARNNNPWVNQDGTFSKEEWNKKKDTFERKIGCNEAILEALLQFNIVISAGRNFISTTHLILSIITI